MKWKSRRRAEELVHKEQQGVCFERGMIMKKKRFSWLAGLALLTGMIFVFAGAAEAARISFIRMVGELYNADDKTDKFSAFEALAKPYKFGGKNTWSIVSLKHFQ